jgi:hypothetical protein
MSDEQSKVQWLARWRAKRQLKHHRTVMDKLLGAVDEDSEEKTAQHYTSRGRELAAEDRRHHIKGGGTGGLA